MFVQRKGGQCDWSVESMKEKRCRWRERPGPDGAEPWTTLRNFDFIVSTKGSHWSISNWDQGIYAFYIFFSVFFKSYCTIHVGLWIKIRVLTLPIEKVGFFFFTSLLYRGDRGNIETISSNIKLNISQNFVSFHANTNITLLPTQSTYLNK